MSSNFRPRLNYSNVIATIALFIALGGAAVAAGLPKKSVGSAQLKRGAVTANAIKKGAVTSGKLAPKSVVAGKLGPNAVLPGNIGNGAITSAKLGAGAVIASTIKNGVVTSNKLQSKAVTTDKLAAGAVTNPILANGSVTPNKLSSEFGPIVSNLKTGQTLRGVFDLGGTAAFAGELAREGVSYQFPLVGAPAVTVLKKGETSANCGGLGTGGTSAGGDRGQPLRLRDRKRQPRRDDAAGSRPAQQHPPRVRPNRQSQRKRKRIRCHRTVGGDRALVRR